MWMSKMNVTRIKAMCSVLKWNWSVSLVLHRINDPKWVIILDYRRLEIIGLKIGEIRNVCDIYFFTYFVRSSLSIELG